VTINVTRRDKRADLPLTFPFTLPPTSSIVMFEEYPSDSESDPAPPPTKAPSRKRKAAASETSTAKKAKAASSSSKSGVLDKEISKLASSLAHLGCSYFTDDDDPEDPERLAEKFARYIKQLETALAEAKSSGGAPAPKQNTRADLEAAAEKIRRAAVSGITKQMTVRVSSFQS
jgi:pyruvate/2-oxoglutarate dehydrogenase complex dihydrolipoamide acyltransferase (E2) component